MSYISSLLWGTSQLDDAVDKATSELLPSGSEDIALNLEISDQIRSKSVPAKDAMRALKRRLNHKNPNVQLLTLGLADTCVKNGGDAFLSEVASREFMDNLVSILKIPILNHDVKTKLLRLIQNWAIAFEGKSTLGYVGEIYKALQTEGFNFPPRDPTVASAMVDTQTAPEWIDSDVCLRCRTAFSFTNRKHHCRNCGQVFDQQCSSKTMALPHFGIPQDVRVCDSCFTKLSKKQKTHRPTQSASSSRHRSAREFADADLQRAIQLSLEEVGAAGPKRPGYVPAPSWQASEPPLVDQRSRPNGQAQEDEEDDPDLRAAIEASLREASAPRPSAPLSIETPRVERQEFAYGIGPGYAQSYPPQSATPKPAAPALPNYDLAPLEEDVILTFSQTVDQLQQQGGRNLSRYPAVVELYDKANGLRPKLAMSINDAGRKEQVLADMHDKLSEAVRLYDRLLTEQISQTSRQTSNSQAYGVYQSPAANSHGQWSASPQLNSPPVTQHLQSPYYNTQQSADKQGPINAYAPPPVQQYAQPHGALQPASLPPQSPRIEYAQYSQTQPYAVTSPHPISVQQYHAAPPTPEGQMPFALPSASAPVQSPVSQQIQTPYPAQAGPPVIQPQTQTPSFTSQSSLTRNNTIAAYSASTSSPGPPAKSLARSHTMSHTPQQLQQLQQTVVPPPMPNFPAVPTGSPQAYHAYSSQTAQPEPQREALLIDL